jgi:hypothetical protein
MNHTIEILRGEFTRFRLTVDGSSRYQPWMVQDDRRLRVSELQAIGCRELFDVGLGNWDDSLMLLPLWALGLVATGEILTSIMGDVAIVGADYIDTDTRGGFTAYGFEHPGFKETKHAAT